MPALSTFGGASARALGFSLAASIAQGGGGAVTGPGRWGTQFNGTNQWVAAAANQATRLGLGEFTIEGFFLTSYAGGNAQVLIEQAVIDESTGNNNGWLLYITSAGNIIFGGAGGQTYISASMPPYLGLWNHVALTRAGGTIRLFVDGLLVGSTTTSVDFDAAFNTGRTDTPTLFGSHEMQLAGSWFNGYLSNWRIVKGSALYTSNFTIPAVPLTAVPGTGLLTFQTDSLLDNSGNNIALRQTYTATTGSSSTFNGGLAVSFNLFTSFAKPDAGEARYQTPGTYSWTAPANVTSVCVLCVGAGGSENSYFARGSAGGGALAYGNAITVVPGTTYTVVVGASPTQGNGQASYFISSSFLNAGGGIAVADGAGIGGTSSGTARTGGGNGGNGGIGGAGDSSGGDAGGGGGAGGYTGNGGRGGDNGWNGGTGPSAGSGGGGGGGSGGFQEGGGFAYGQNGGGVGLFGQGANGAAGGGAGSGGSGVLYGGGGGGGYTSAGVTRIGGGGAVRIIWGQGRAFPSTNVDLASSLGNVTVV